jgi:hypothetical protein
MTKFGIIPKSLQSVFTYQGIIIRFELKKFSKNFDHPSSAPRSSADINDNKHTTHYDRRYLMRRADQKICPDLRKVSDHHREISPHRLENIPNHREISADRTEINPDREEINPDREEINPDRVEIIPDRVEIIPDHTCPTGVQRATQQVDINP